MRDGRIVYIGAERVDDVTSHPAFREGAKTIAGLYDLKADPYEMKNLASDPAVAKEREAVKKELRKLVAEALGI